MLYTYSLADIYIYVSKILLLHYNRFLSLEKNSRIMEQGTLQRNYTLQPVLKVRYVV